MQHVAPLVPACLSACSTFSVICFYLAQQLRSRFVGMRSFVAKHPGPKATFIFAEKTDRTTSPPPCRSAADAGLFSPPQKKGVKKRKRPSEQKPTKGREHLDLHSLSMIRAGSGADLPFSIHLMANYQSNLMDPTWRSRAKGRLMANDDHSVFRISLFFYSW